jgi:riboflavin kinase / FMN adenylyltransferase
LFHYEIIAPQMRIIRELHDSAEKFPNPVLTLGNFDGVHLGHRALFRKIVERARALNGTSVVFTFEPHPLKVLAPESSPRLLNTFDAKMKLFNEAGINIAICTDFTRRFAEQDPEEFVRSVLYKQIGVKEVYVGYNYAFGKDRGGSIESLKRIGHDCGFFVGVVEAVVVDNMVASSSVARDLIVNGRVEEAAKLLGRWYSIEGSVIHGANRGHSLGFPTANLKTLNELIPPYGVYAVLAEVDGSILQGVASIGVRPTFESGPASIEVYLFDFSGDLYGKQIELSFVRFIREEQKFPDVPSLISRMQKDEDEAKKILHKWTGG